MKNHKRVLLLAIMIIAFCVDIVIIKKFQEFLAGGQSQLTLEILKTIAMMILGISITLAQFFIGASILFELKGERQVIYCIETVFVILLFSLLSAISGIVAEDGGINTFFLYAIKVLKWALGMSILSAMFGIIFMMPKVFSDNKINK